MKKIIKYFLAILVEIVVSVFIGCNKEKAAIISTTSVSESVTDIDGNIYKTVTIGGQVWMKENLKTTRYSNGDLIETTAPATLDISSEITPKYQWAFDGNEKNVATYGRLYTWYTVTDSRKLCPTGWHVPSDAEWTILTDYVYSKGYSYQGRGKLVAKSLAATSGWRTDPTAGNIGNDQTSNNKSGFTAMPGGGRYLNGTFYELGDSGNWWSTTQVDATYAYCFYLYSGSGTTVNPGSSKQSGFSVRCLKIREN